MSDLTEGCPDGTKYCGSECVSVTDPAYGCRVDSCEPCGLAEGAATMGCAKGSCAVAQCRSDYKLCGARCVTRLEPEYGCARPNCDPCAFAYATSVGCDKLGQCEILECGLDRGNCDGKLDNGCEVLLKESVLHCGECNNVCQTALPDAEGTCGGGNCAIRRCLVANKKDCDGVVGNGCETNILEDASHCGGCNKPCEEGQSCVNGVCDG
jgi:hypothetical protein